MKFFKRLWLAKSESQNNGKKTQDNSYLDYKFKIYSNSQNHGKNDKYKKLQENADILQKRLEQNNNVSDDRVIVSPDEFFTSPEAVELYKEEKLMSTWIIVDLDNNDEDEEDHQKSKNNSENNKSLAIIKGKPILTTYDKECFKKSLMGPMLEPIFVSASGVSQIFHNKKGLSIQQAFGLSDNGTLLVNLDHILICKGIESCHFEFSIFSSYEKGVEITDQYRIERHFSLLRKFFHWLKMLLGTYF